MTAWPTAISTEPPCTQLTPSSANEHVENADTRGAEIAQNEPLPIDPLENAIGQIPPSDLEGLPTALGSIAEIQTDDTDKKSGGLSRRSW